MNRRAFLKLTLGAAVVATIPIPRFLTPELPVAKGEPGQFLMSDGTGNMHWAGGTLTAEMIEEAAARSAMNMGKADMLIMSEQAYEDLRKWYQPGIKIVYE